MKNSRVQPRLFRGGAEPNGINSGNVILGNLGCERHRLEYAMIGDNVNIGQRLESSAPKQGCMLSAETYELVKDHVDVGDLQEIEVKERQKVRAYVLRRYSRRLNTNSPIEVFPVTFGLLLSPPTLTLTSSQPSLHTSSPCSFIQESSLERRRFTWVLYSFLPARFFISRESVSRS